MNKFELFTLIYFVLDAYYEDEVNTNEKLHIALSDMNPFVWKELISADSAIYKAYSDFIGNREITLSNSLEIAKEYVKTVSLVDMSEAFETMTDDEWGTAYEAYLASDHKGSSKSC